jgi:hypothetical protein
MQIGIAGPGPLGGLNHVLMQPNAGQIQGRSKTRRQQYKGNNESQPSQKTKDHRQKQAAMHTSSELTSKIPR